MSVFQIQEESFINIIHTGQDLHSYADSGAFHSSSSSSGKESNVFEKYHVHEELFTP